MGLKVLKSRLSEYVRLAASGEAVLVTNRGRVVAELVPPREGRSILGDALPVDAVRDGWLTPPLLVSKVPPPRAPVAPVAQILKGLKQDRNER